MNNSLIIKSVIVAIIINLVLPFLVKPFATAIQIKPPTGAANLNFFDQIMHMFVHHNQVPVASSLIVSIIVALSIYLSPYVKV